MFSATVRENIIFEALKKSDQSSLPEKYLKILKLTQLVEDLRLLAGSDLTQIGANGINLSGGQKQRIAIARSIYQDSDLYFFDDFLSALDSLVAKSIFRDVLTGYLQGKTRIMTCGKIGVIERELEQYLESGITSQDEVQVLLLKDRNIVRKGTWQSIKSSQEFQEFIQEEKSKEKLEDIQIKDRDDELEQPENAVQDNLSVMSSVKSENAQNVVSKKETVKG